MTDSRNSRPPFLPTLALALGTMASAVSGSAQGYTAADARTELAVTARTGGYWLTSNAEYVEPGTGAFEEYAMRFQMIDGGLAHTGCMWGITDGEPSDPLWFFFTGWDPRDGSILVYQLSPAGAVASGHHRPRDDGEVGAELVQTLWAPGQPSRRIRHIQSRPDADTHHDRTFLWTNDEWIPRREYTWTWTESEAAAPC